MTPHQYEQALIHLNLHYGNDQGFIALCPRIDGKLAQRMWPHNHARKAMETLPSEGDLYFSLNAFAKPKNQAKLSRRASSLWYLHAFYVDLDTVKAGLDPLNVVEVLERDYWGVRVPTPTYSILSGRGVWAVWTIRPAKNDKAGRTVERWRETQAFLLDVLEPFGADPSCNDVSRICRIAGSTNPKNGATVRLKVYQPEGRYALDDLYDFVPKPVPLPTPLPSIQDRFDASSLYWPTTPEDFEYPSRQQHQATRDNKPRLTPNTWLRGALSDLETLAYLRQLRDGEGRNNILFRYAVWQFTLTRDPAQTMERTQAFNMRFDEPLPDTEVKSTVASACKEFTDKVGQTLPRRFKTAGTVKTLNITADEQNRMKVLIGPQEKRRRDLQRKANQRRAKGTSTRADMERQRRDQLAEALRSNPEATNRSLARILQWHPDTVRKYRERLCHVQSS